MAYVRSAAPPLFIGTRARMRLVPRMMSVSPVGIPGEGMGKVHPGGGPHVPPLRARRGRARKSKGRGKNKGQDKCTGKGRGKGKGWGKRRSWRRGRCRGKGRGKSKSRNKRRSWHRGRCSPCVSGCSTGGREGGGLSAVWQMTPPPPLPLPLPRPLAFPQTLSLPQSLPLPLPLPLRLPPLLPPPLPLFPPLPLPLLLPLPLALATAAWPGWEAPAAQEPGPWLRIGYGDARRAFQMGPVLGEGEFGVIRVVVARGSGQELGGRPC